MTNNPVTYDLSKFGNRELVMVVDLVEGLIRSDMEIGEKIKIGFNMNSGYVFLSNEDFGVYMMNDQFLSEWFSCPECDTEGFSNELLDTENDCCEKYIHQRISF